MISDEIMAEIDLALDDIISKQKPMNRQNNGKRRSQRIDEPLTSFRGGGRSKRGFGGGASRGSFGGDGRIGFPVNKSRVGQNDVVWINIANLPESVVTDDLKELFQDFSVQGLGVHYDEFGQHMGTADLFVDSRSAKAILREFANIAIDGQRIRFAIVNEQAADTPQFQTHQRRAGGRQPIRPRPRFNRPNAFDKKGGGRSDSQQSTRTYSRSRSPLNRRAAGVFKKNNPPRNQRKNSAATRQEMKSTDELDRELEAYMKGNKHPRIKLDE